MKAWFDFLSSQTLQPLQDNDAICALRDTGLLYVGGDDASEFLQNQLSNDIQLTSPSLSQLSSFSNAKGRMFGIFRVIQIEGGYLLVLPHSILAEVQDQLHRYILRSKVILADITDSFCLFSITTGADDPIQHEALPDQVNQVYQSDSLISVCLPSASGRRRHLLIDNSAEEAIALWQQFATRLAVNDQQQWRLQEIDAGIPTVYPSTSGAFVLQMSNLQLLDGVSFKKGCYPGQEVVARMQYLGKLKRRMYLAEIKGVCPQPGDELQSRDSDKADGSGKVVDAIQLDQQNCRLLFIGQIEKAESDKLVLSAQIDAKMNLLPLPYAYAD
ncbi:MAG: folate-binding protein [Gammaproteobacteria bacterium]|nr:folate-binding protein [Gammaproteobacteria bacterium]